MNSTRVAWKNSTSTFSPGPAAPPRPATATLTREAVTGRIGLIEGTELVGEFKSSGYSEPSRLVCRSDGRHVRLSPVLYGVVKSLDHHAGAGPTNRHELLSRVAEEVSHETGLELTADHITYLLDRKLAPLGITTDSNGRRPTVARAEPFLSLRLKKALLPSSATWFLGGLFGWLFRPVVVVAVVTAALVSEVWVFATQPMGSALAESLADPTGVLLVSMFAVFSAFFHEIGHASGCRYAGARPGTMGFGVYLVWPVFYTDITNTYRLDRRGRLRAVLGGVYFNALFVIGLTVLYLWTGSPVFLAVIVITNIELVQQLLPTLRFDGYYIVSDLVGIPDLFRYIGPILKRTVLRQPPDARLQALKTWPQRVVTVWVLVVIPVLLVQLGFIAFNVPHFIDIAWQRVRTIGSDATMSGFDLFDVVGDVSYTMLAVLPLAGLTVIVLQAARGALSLLRLNPQGDAGTPADAPTGAPVTLGPPARSRGWRPHSPTANYLLGFTVVLVTISSAYLLAGGSSGSSDPSASPQEPRAGTPRRAPSASKRTTTTISLPPGDDVTVQAVVDGDSFEWGSGDKVRLIGVDAPDMETGACFSPEATEALTGLLPPGTTVRLVYGAERFDQYGRTLAYVYRLPDGLFVNRALASDGFAYAVTNPSDATHVAELSAAETEARDAGRGLWASCPPRSGPAVDASIGQSPRRSTGANTVAPASPDPPAPPPPGSDPPAPPDPGQNSAADPSLLERLLDLLPL